MEFERTMPNETLARQIDRAASLSESVLEDRFWHLIRRTTYRCSWAGIHAQVHFGRYRVDSLFTKNDGTQIVVECDGAAFHDYRRDLDRDAELLSAHGVGEVIRLPFPAVMYYEEGTTALLTMWHNEFNWHRPGCVMTPEEFMTQFRHAQDDEYWWTTEEFLEWAEPNWDVITFGDRRSSVCGPKAHMCGFKRQYLTRVCAGDRLVRRQLA